MSLDLPAPRPELTTYPLVMERTLGKAGQVETRVSIGTAEPYPITADRVTDDPDLAAALIRSNRHDYYGVYLVCGFLEAAPETVERATFSVVLSYADPAAGDAPIAWSLWPRKLAAKPVHETKSVEGSIGVKLGVDLELKGGVDKDADVEQCYLVAAGEREPDPEWRFRRTATTALGGSHHLWLVARVDRGREAVAEYGVNARVNRPKFGIARTRVDVPDQKRTVYLR
jgi:hypothetical protein